jgi:hypothetical protein
MASDDMTFTVSFVTIENRLVQEIKEMARNAVYRWVGHLELGKDEEIRMIMLGVCKYR